MQRLLAFEHHCLHIVGKIFWDDAFSNPEVRYEVLLGPLGQALNLNMLRWLYHVLHMPTEGLLHCMLFFEPDNGWQMSLGGRLMIWKKV